jgi:hypothetical protein
MSDRISPDSTVEPAPFFGALLVVALVAAIIAGGLVFLLTAHAGGC